MNLKYSFILALAMTAQGFGCATSPEGRNQLMLMPDSSVNQQGAESFEQLKKTTPIDSSARTNTYVKCIANAIIDSNKDRIPQDNWEIVVFNTKDVNAFALPGAKIGVFEGILPVAQTPSQLAAVIGHEIGHVIARHGNERMSTALLAQGVEMGVGMAAKDSHYQSAVMAAMGVGAQFGVLLPFSRRQEAEADLIGLELMAKAGFNPQEAITLWQNMSVATKGKQPPQIMSDHPSNENRIAALNDHLPAALQVYNQVKSSAPGSRCRSLGAKIIRRLPFNDVELFYLKLL